MTKNPSPDLRSEIAALWADARPTPLIDLPTIAAVAGVSRVLAKLEGERPLGNFKALGGTVAGLRALARWAGCASVEAMLSSPKSNGPLPRLVCASDGNHGLSVAAAAKRAGTGATIFLPAGVDRRRIERIEGLGGEAKCVAGTYDDAVLEAVAAAERGEGLLIPDTSQNLQDLVVKDVMTGYSLMTTELKDQLKELGARPTHAFVQAGVGGLAAAVAEGFDGHPLHLAVVEPRSAACVAAALKLGRPVLIGGTLETAAEMLSCGLASAPALEILLRDDARSVLVEEDELHDAVVRLGEESVRTTPSGAAGLAGLMRATGDIVLLRTHRLNVGSIALLIITENAIDKTA